MFQVIRNGENRIDVDFAGKLDSNDMRAGIDELTRKADGIEHGRMLYRIGEFELPTLGAMAVEVSRIPQLFRVIRRFDRMAVVADKKWVRTVSEVEGSLIPGLTIKTFDSRQVAEAESWLQR
ncbi:STAS/SEC14 domain-containing protein [Pseudomonas sp. GCM10022186]|uniref:STAS/SEC14 domain-containing protein n=1 Tax=Pseudomonas sp. GCM10022186 TaxID=3252650 RepID=UPI00361B8A10